MMSSNEAGANKSFSNSLSQKILGLIEQPKYPWGSSLLNLEIENN